jgi:hypothetical protein
MAAKKDPTVESSEEKKTTQINLGEVVNNYLEALQRVHDVVNYTLAAERLLNEDEYDEFSRQSRVMPSQKTRMSYDGAKEEMNRWLLKQTLNETLGVLVLFLDDTRTISTLSTWKSKGGEGDIQKMLQEERLEFARLDLPGKINYLREKHSISSPSEEHIISLYKLRRSLATRDGTVPEAEATDGKLALKLRSVQLKTAPSAEASQPGGVFVTSEVGDIVREFNQGETIRISKGDHLAIVLTVAFFITSQAQSLKEFAQSLGVTK